MIAWWGWILIWTGLVLGLLIMLALVLWWLIRKGLVLLEELGRLADTLSVLDVQEVSPSRPPIAVLEPLATVERRRADQKDRRRFLKDERLRRRMLNAKRITSVSASEGPWPASWSEPKAR